MTKYAATLIVSCMLVACGPTTEETPGEETSPCNDGLCLGDLMCLSNLCVDPDWQPGSSGSSPSEGGGDDDGSTENAPTEPVDQVDVLFVIDNSGSMGEEQANLSESIGSFTAPLEDAGMSVRVAITTTDDGNYWCNGNNVSMAESGQHVLSSCRTRLNEFYFAGDDTNAETACTDFCDDDTLPGVGSDSWLEFGTSTNFEGSINSLLRCALPQGINGCGFESTLESTRKALLRTELTGEPESGFIREGAHLAIVFVTDEADCSFNRDHQSTVFGEDGAGNQVFWSLPDQQQPSSAVCWNAGVDCDFSLDQDQCTAVDKNVDGGPATDADDAAIYPVDRFRSQLESIRESKLAFGADVFTFGIVGVPSDYPEVGRIAYAEGPTNDDPGSFQNRFGIGPGCTSQVAEAVPPVRIRELVENSAWGDNGQLYSICDSDYGPALADIAGTVVDYTP